MALATVTQMPWKGRKSSGGDMAGVDETLGRSRRPPLASQTTGMGPQQEAPLSAVTGTGNVKDSSLEAPLSPTWSPLLISITVQALRAYRWI